MTEDDASRCRHVLTAVLEISDGDDAEDFGPWWFVVRPLAGRRRLRFSFFLDEPTQGLCVQFWFLSNQRIACESTLYRLGLVWPLGVTLV